jgi:hypothetical protein
LFLVVILTGAFLVVILTGAFLAVILNGVFLAVILNGVKDPCILSLFLLLPVLINPTHRRTCVLSHLRACTILCASWCDLFERCCVQVQAKTWLEATGGLSGLRLSDLPCAFPEPISRRA